MANRLECTFRLFLLFQLGVFSCTQMTCMARDVSSDVLEDMEDAIMKAKTCHEWGYGNCTEHAGCSACKWRFRWPTIEFCTSNTTAIKLPKSRFLSLRFSHFLHRLVVRVVFVVVHQTAQAESCCSCCCYSVTRLIR